MKIPIFQAQQKIEVLLNKNLLRSNFMRVIREDLIFQTWVNQFNKI